MSVYVDDAAIMWKGKLRFHMIADSLDELHEFASRVGIRPCWFHRSKSSPHYDITEPQKHAALAAGAQAVTGRELVEIIRRTRTR